MARCTVLLIWIPKLVSLDLKSHKLIITWWTSILHNFLFKYLSLAVKRLTIPVNINFEYFFWLEYFSLAGRLTVPVGIIASFPWYGYIDFESFILNCMIVWVHACVFSFSFFLHVYTHFAVLPVYMWCAYYSCIFSRDYSHDNKCNMYSFLFN